MSSQSAQAWAYYAERLPEAEALKYWTASRSKMAATIPGFVEEERAEFREYLKAVAAEARAEAEQTKAGNWTAHSAEVERLKSEAYAFGWTAQQWKAVRVVFADDTTLIAKMVDGARQQAAEDALEDAALTALMKKSAQPPIPATAADKLTRAEAERRAAKTVALGALHALDRAEEQVKDAHSEDRQERSEQWWRSILGDTAQPI